MVQDHLIEIVIASAVLSLVSLVFAFSSWRRLRRMKKAVALLHRHRFIGGTSGVVTWFLNSEGKPVQFSAIEPGKPLIMYGVSGPGASGICELFLDFGKKAPN